MDKRFVKKSFDEDDEVTFEDFMDSIFKSEHEDNL